MTIYVANCKLYYLSDSNFLLMDHLIGNLPLDWFLTRRLPNNGHLNGNLVDDRHMNSKCVFQCHSTGKWLKTGTNPVIGHYLFYFHCFIYAHTFHLIFSLTSINPNLGGGSNFTPPLPLWFFLNNSETVKAATLAFCSIYQHFIRNIRGKFGIAPVSSYWAKHRRPRLINSPYEIKYRWNEYYNNLKYQ